MYDDLIKFVQLARKEVKFDLCGLTYVCYQISLHLELSFKKYRTKYQKYKLFFGLLTIYYKLNKYAMFSED